jgi:hypothetical protein
MLISWNTTPTSSLGAASPLDSTNGSLRQSAVASCFCAAASQNVEMVVATDGASSSKQCTSSPAFGSTEHCATLPPSPASVSPVQTTVTLVTSKAHEAAHPGNAPGAPSSVRCLAADLTHNNSIASEAGSLLCDEDDDEVVGVTADGELLFRKRDGADHYYEQRPLSRHHNSRAPPSPHRSAVPTLRPTPHRTQPRPTAFTPSSAASSACDLQQPHGRAMSPPPADGSLQRADRQLFGDIPSVFETPVLQVQPPTRAAHRPAPMDTVALSEPHNGGRVAANMEASSQAVIALTIEDLRFAQLAMRVRDRENDIYAQHVHEDFSTLCRIREQHERQLLNERFRRTTWDLRRF